MVGKNKIPQFYFPESHLQPTLIEYEEKQLSQLFNKDELNVEEFIPITTEFLGFPKILNIVLFNKIKEDNSDKISIKQFSKYVLYELYS